MPNKTTERNAYTIDTKIFLDEWLDAVTSVPPKTMAELVAILQLKCDADPENAGESKKLTASMLSGKMNYYRRGWDVKLVKPEMPKSTGGDRAKTKTDTIQAFRDAGMIEE